MKWFRVTLSNGDFWKDFDIRVEQAWQAEDAAIEQARGAHKELPANDWRLVKVEGIPA